MRYLAIAVILFASLSPQFVVAQNKVRGHTERPDKASQLGPVLNIWVDDVQNIEPAVAYNFIHDQYLVVWANLQPGGNTDLYARRVRASDGALLSNFTIATEPGAHFFEPDVAYCGGSDEYLVAYSFEGSGSVDGDVVVRHITWNGANLHLPQYQPYRVGRSDPGGTQHKPAVTANDEDGEFLVVYQNTFPGHDDVDAVRVQAIGGGMLGWSNVATGSGELRTQPDVAHCIIGNTYLIAYTYQPSSPLDPGEVVYKVATSNLGYMTPEEHIFVSSIDQQTVVVTDMRYDFLMVWEEVAGPTTSLYAQRLDNIGVPFGPTGGFPIVHTNGVRNEAPSVEFGSYNGSLIVWQREIAGPGSRVFGRYVAPDQDTAQGAEIAFGSGGAYWRTHPAVACATNGNCLMVEEDSWPGADYEIRGQIAMFHIFSDRFESGNTSAWSSAVP